LKHGGTCPANESKVKLRDVLILWSSLAPGSSRSIETSVFRGLAPNVAACLLAAREEALLWTLVGARGLSFIQAIGSPRWGLFSGCVLVVLSNVFCLVRC
jgi:hypothetical protein